MGLDIKPDQLPAVRIAEQMLDVKRWCVAVREVQGERARVQEQLNEFL